MAILLVALAPLGINPGPGLVESNSEIPWLMVWALAFSNVIAGGLILVAARYRRLIPQGNRAGYVPYIYLFALLSVFLSTHAWPYFLVFAIFAAIGLAFKLLDWPRAPFVIGMVLGPVAEDALVKSLGIWGPEFILRPVSLGLAALLLLSMVTLTRRLVSRTRAVKEGLGHGR